MAANQVIEFERVSRKQVDQTRSAPCMAQSCGFEYESGRFEVCAKSLKPGTTMLSLKIRCHEPTLFVLVFYTLLMRSVVLARKLGTGTEVHIVVRCILY